MTTAENNSTPESLPELHDTLEFPVFDYHTDELSVGVIEQPSLSQAAVEGVVEIQVQAEFRVPTTEEQITAAAKRLSDAQHEIFRLEGTGSRVPRRLLDTSAYWGDQLSSLRTLQSTEKRTVAAANRREYRKARFARALGDFVGLFRPTR